MSLELQSVSLGLSGRQLIAPFDLEIGAGEIVTLMGPSGCGKSSLLSAVAGSLAAPFTMRGKVLLNRRDLSGVMPSLRRIGRLFQDDLLFPHLSVGENLMFGMARGPRGPRLARMRGALQAIGLEGLEQRAPHTLSGGQRQRVALMRSLLAGPEAMLLDEPFSKLDVSLRAAMRELAFAKLQEAGTPALLVTHDEADAPPEGRVFLIENAEVKRVR